MLRDQQRCYICKAPDHIRKVSPAEYEPEALPVGPYHANVGDAAAAAKARRLKQQCLDEVVRLSGRNRGEFIEQMRSIVGKARAYYADEIGMGDDALAEMLLLDGCFVLVSLRGTEGPKQQITARSKKETESSSSDGRRSSFSLGENDEENQMAAAATTGITMDSWHHFYVARDLFLLENQIPFVVVQKIYELLVKDIPCAERSVVSAVAAYVREVVGVYAKGAGMAAQPPAEHVDHLLHLCHIHLRPTIQQRPSWSDDDDGKFSGGATVGRLLRVTQYRELMVRFKKLDITGSKAAPGVGSILDVTFRGGALEIPRLDIDGGTLRQMANLILLEQGSPHVGLYFTAYCAFMAQVAGTAEDVALLVERGIIVHHLGCDGYVADGFKKLCDGIIFEANDDTYNYLRPVYQALEKHCRDRRRRLISWLRGHANYPNPWILVGIVAIITLLCLIVQQLQHVTFRNHAN
ncbi:hypothetical protein ABZP36_010553 [Zizania latifolia]